MTDKPTTDFKKWESNCPKNLLKMIVGGGFGEDPQSRISEIKESRLQDSEHALSRIGIGPQDIVLDLGAGFGWLSALAAEKANKVYCADISHSLIDQARKENSQFKNIQFLVHEREDLSPLYDQGITKAVSLSVFPLFNFYECTIYLQELYKTLQSDGLLYFDYFNSQHLNVSKDRTFLRNLEHYRNDRESLLNISHWHHAENIEHLATQMNFEVLKHDTSEMLSWVVLRKS